MLVAKYLLLISLISIQVHNGLLQSVTLKIADGKIRGLVNQTIRKKATYYSFRGIPYAQPPEGNLRFTNPVKNTPWNGTWDATYDRSQCTQFAADDFIGTEVYGQEDCLYINVYTTNYNATDLPVIVWIHGGGFRVGNSSYENFGPDHFLEEGLVFVSLNYRLGIFGFLSTEDEACPGNWGIKDQILALKWVQENIAFFGGSPKNVTIYGQSAGSVSVHLLLQTELTEGLFQRAIMNSGSTLNLWSLNTRAAVTATLLGTRLGIITLDSNELVEDLRKVDAESLQKAAWLAGAGLFVTNALRGLPFAPAMEPNISGAVYTNPSDDALKKGNFHHVPVLMGFNSNEVAAVGDIPALLRFYLVGYALAPGILDPYSMTSHPIKRVLATEEIREHYLINLGVLLGTENVIEFISADQFNRPIRRAASDMSNYTTVYFYEFGYQGEIPGVGERTYLGTGHAEDNAYLFRSYNSYNDTDMKVSEKLVRLWSNFAKYGDPTPEQDSLLDNAIWDPVDPSSSDFSYMSINSTLVKSVNPKQADWEFYQYLWDKYGDDTELTTY